jgi:hypothetical protein
MTTTQITSESSSSSKNASDSTTLKRDSRSQHDLRLEGMVFCTLALLGGLLISVVLVTGADWYFPFLFFIAVAYYAWQRYFD